MLLVAALALGAILALLPILLVAALTFSLCALLRALCRAYTRKWLPGWLTRWLPVLLTALGVAARLAWAWHSDGAEPRDVLIAAGQGYLDVQVAMAVALVAAWRETRLESFDWWAFGLGYVRQVWQVWGYAMAAGSVLGAIAFVVFSFRERGTERNENAWRPGPLVSADKLARWKGKGEARLVDGLTARGRLTAITALPKQGKSVAFCGLLKARQTAGRWFGRRCTMGRTLVLTEEDRGTFSAKVQQFGINGKTLVARHAPEYADAAFRPEAWERLIFDAAKAAKRAKCDTLCVDTLTTWAPWAFRGPEHMSTCLRTFKRAIGTHHLAGCVILHNRKQKSDDGAVVDMLGTIAGSAAYDVIAGFKREKATGECTLTVDGRLGEWECTARLEGQRYLPMAEAPEAAPAETLAAPAIPAHLQDTLEALRAAGDGGLNTTAIQVATGGAAATVLARLTALEALGMATRSGAGRRGDPLVWRAVALPPPPPAPPPTADPAYVRYLGSKAWAEKRAAILGRANGACEGCGEGTADEDVEVHHLHYQTLYHESPDDLIGLCPGCHRRAHA